MNHTPPCFSLSLWQLSMVACALLSSLSPTALPNPAVTVIVLTSPASFPTPVPAWGDERIAFVSNRNGNPDIYLMNPDGSDVIQLTSHPGDEDDPAWSPDGSRIAFASLRDGNLDIYIINTDGSGEMRLTDAPGYERSPSWSPDSSQIVFVSEVPVPSGNFPEFTRDIAVINVDGSGLKRLTEDFPFKDSYPAWSPDGSRIAFVSTMKQYCCEIFTVRPDGTERRQMTNFEMQLWFPDWSPDGEKIAFGGENDYIQLGGAIYVINADGSGLASLTNSPTRADWAPTWSPDGTKIAFDATLEGEINRSLYVMNADGSYVTRLSEDSASGSEPAWSP